MSIFSHIFALQGGGVQLRRNALYIQGELPGLEMPDPLRRRIEALCASWIVCSEEVVNELGEISETRTETFAQAVERKTAAARRQIMEAAMASKPCVDAIRKAIAAGTASPALAILIMESATNVFNAIPPTPEPNET